MALQETNYMDELEAATCLKPSKPIIFMLFTIVAFITFFFVWAGITQVEELTRGQGQVVPSKEIQVVQSLEGGILQELLIQKGSIVKKGQILMRLSDVQFSSEERGTEARFTSLEAKKARLSAEASGNEFKVPQNIKDKMPKIAQNEEALYHSRQKELQSAFAMQDENIKKAKADLAELGAEINRLSESKRLLNKELTITRDMVAKRAVPKLEQIRLERELADIGGQINARVQEKKGLQAALASAENERNAQNDKFRSSALEDLNEVETEIAGLKENLKSMGDRVDRREIRAPVDGIVNQIMLQTIGGIVEPAMKLVEIVPMNDELKIIAKVKPNEIAFINVGYPAKVKISAYDPQRYGALNGQITRVAANSAKDAEGNILFEVEVKTTKNHLGSAEKPLPITPGMVADVEIITGKRTILNYLMKPLHKGFERALRER
ncbi:MAG: HlyD family type I secretion periplasmic adaptor subunit [Alphaproteobacteria bacterium]